MEKIFRSYVVQPSVTGCGFHTCVSVRNCPKTYKSEDPFDQVVFLVLGLIIYSYSCKVGKQVPDEHVDLSQVSKGGVPLSIRCLSLTHVYNFTHIHGLVISPLLFAKLC
jgi:hypothetical protein